MLKTCHQCGAPSPHGYCPLHPKQQKRGSTRQWRNVRTIVLSRDNGVCHLCHQQGADSVDHLIPKAHGGTDHPSNLKAAHLSCNSSRKARPLPQP